MGDDTRRQVFNRQDGLCSICQCHLAGEFVLHHIRNRCQGGPTVASNLEARHRHCEEYAHKNFCHGNPGGEYVNSVLLPELPRNPKHRRLRSDKRRRHDNLSSLPVYVHHHHNWYRVQVLRVLKRADE